MDDIDYAAVVATLEEHWGDFAEYSGGEESADRTLAALKREGNLE
ncbi:hypothetical protein [Desulfolutivibrio sulfodismutans]|nr:hypothetical protein [Desulfolutivibrio sulfodismutans]